MHMNNGMEDFSGYKDMVLGNGGEQQLAPKNTPSQPNVVFEAKAWTSLDFYGELDNFCVGLTRLNKFLLYKGSYPKGAHSFHGCVHDFIV